MLVILVVTKLGFRRDEKKEYYLKERTNEKKTGEIAYHEKRKKSVNGTEKVP